MSGWLFWMVLRPPPFLRLLPICGGFVFGLFSSFMPFIIVLRVTPESRLTRLTPPCPMVFASVAIDIVGVDTHLVLATLFLCVFAVQWCLF
jgi:hypothetical protein